MKAFYLNDWNEPNWQKLEGADFVRADFEVPPEQFAGVNILLASYLQEGYEGDAFVLFQKDGKLFEVNGGHCSCYGLEGQWEPKESSVEELRHRLEKGYLGRHYNGGSIFADQLKEVLDALPSSPMGETATHQERAEPTSNAGHEASTATRPSPMTPTSDA